MKRETSVSVTDLQDLVSISDSVKRISLRDGEGAKKTPETSPLRQGGGSSTSGSPIQEMISGLPSFQVQSSGTALFPAEVGGQGHEGEKGGNQGTKMIKRSSDDGESLSSSRSRDRNSLSAGNPSASPLDNRQSLESLASRASSMVQGTVLDNMTTQQSFLNKYEFLNEVGRGGFSRVYRCRSRIDTNEYAVKVIDLRPMRLREKFDPARLRREVDIMQKLKHPNIVQFFEGYETDDSVLMVMELCPGKELFDVILERNSFAEKDAKPVFSQICSAVYYLHCLNIIHRDIKPENVLVLNRPGPDGNLMVKLLDFGLSKNAGTGSEAKTFVGTPCYLAPEVEYTSKGLGGTYGLPADCWSLGAVLYVMLVARFPEFEQDITGKVVLKLSPALWGHISPEAKDLVNSLMNTNQYARLTASATLQNGWFGQYGYTGEQLARVHASVGELGDGLQNELDRGMAVDNEEMTAGGTSVHPTDMVLRRGQEYGQGTQTNQLQLAPLFQLQKSIAACFADAHAAYQDIPEVATDIRRGAVLCRNQFQESMKMLYKVEQTSAAVLDMFPDLELAVDEGVPELANEFFTIVKGWVVDLRELVSSTQKANHASMIQIQTIVESSTVGLKNSGRSLPSSMKLPKGVINMVQKQMLTNGEDTMDGSTQDISLSPDQVLELFLGLFGQVQPLSPSRSASNLSPTGKSSDSRTRTRSREIPDDIVDLDMEEEESFVEDVQAVDVSSSNSNNNRQFLTQTDATSMDEVAGTPPTAAAFRPPELVIPAEADIASEGRRPSGSASNSKKENAALAAVAAMREMVSGTSSTAKSRLAEALDKLHEVDIILEQLSAFWTNTEVVLDRLTKKGQHVEQFIAFSQKPKLLARFKERLEEYRRFWEGINQLCKNFIHPQTNNTATTVNASSSDASFYSAGSESLNSSQMSSSGGDSGSGATSRGGSVNGGRGSVEGNAFMTDFMDRSNTMRADSLS